MITSFEIKDPSNTHISWMPKVPALAKPCRFEFKPGLNILWGRNGSGKSTIITAMARLLHCEQSGFPVMTRSSVQALAPRTPILEKEDPSMLARAVELRHDGQGVRSFDPGRAVGLVGGSFDDDFFMEGLRNTMLRASSGETTRSRFDALIMQILDGKVPTPDVRFGDPNAEAGARVNSLWERRAAAFKEFLKGTEPEGPPTVLLDEPERSLDLPTQVLIWRWIRAYSTRIQFIVASHSLFALQIPEAHYIEMSEGYLQASLKAIRLVSEQLENGIEDPASIAEDFEDFYARTTRA